MSKFAYVTLLLNSDYLPGTLTLAQSIKETGSTIPIILLFSKLNINDEVYDILNKSGYFNRLIDIDQYLLTSRNEFELKDLLKRSDLSFTLTKLNIWKLIDYDKLVYLDSDIIVVKNLDHLFNQDLQVGDILASSDSGWPDIFNSGLFVIKPDLSVFDQLMKFYQNTNSFDGADQGLLNEFFNLQSLKTGGNWIRLPFTYNCTLNSNYEYLPAMLRFKDSINVFHFIGVIKPWKNHNLCYDNSKFLNIFNNNNDNLYSLWWNCFNNISISGYSNLEVLQVSGNLQKPIALFYESLGKQDNVISSYDETSESVFTSAPVQAPASASAPAPPTPSTNSTNYNEISNPFYTPASSGDHYQKYQPVELNFPIFYYKKPDTEDIVDESSKGEAWKMEEGKFDWPREEFHASSHVYYEAYNDSYNEGFDSSNENNVTNNDNNNYGDNNASQEEHYEEHYEYEEHHDKHYEEHHEEHHEEHQEHHEERHEEHHEQNHKDSSVENPVDKYVNEHPIFPWEKRESTTPISRTFVNAGTFEPPIYSISVMDDDDDNIESAEELSSILSGRAELEEEISNKYPNDDQQQQQQALVGFQDGDKFAKYLEKVEKLNKRAKESHNRHENIREEVEDLNDEISKGLKLQDEMDEELEQSELDILEHEESDDVDEEAYDISKEDAKVERELDNMDNDIAGRLGHIL